MTLEPVERLRLFSRDFTRRVGALEARFLGRDRPLGEARLLFEIGAEGAQLRVLRARLGLDSGYLSRMLQSLERAGLARVAPDERDRRVRVARLTEAGLAERAELDRRAEAAAQALLAPLGRSARARLASALEEAERLLSAGEATVAAEDPDSPAARWCLEQYALELNRRFDAGFDPARSIPADPRDMRPPRGVLMLARRGDEPLGCGALKRTGESTADVKRMWVAPEARGLGVGRRLLEALEAHAARVGVTRLRLETNGALTEAQALYRGCGYREVAPFSDEPYAHHWFEKRLPAAR